MYHVQFVSGCVGAAVLVTAAPYPLLGLLFVVHHERKEQGRTIYKDTIGTIMFHTITTWTILKYASSRYTSGQNAAILVFVPALCLVFFIATYSHGR